MTLQVITFGCRLNSYESELIKKSAEESGLENAIIFNSCAVTSEAERQLRQAIRKAKRDNPTAKIIVTGCAAQLHPDKYSSMSEIDKVIGNSEKTESKSYSFELESEKILVNDIMSVKETSPQLIDGLEGRARAFLQIQNGCNHRCTFCIIPYARGNSRSVPIGEIVNQCKSLVENGYHEVVLTGVDITDYGSDLPGAPKLGQMVRRLLNLVPDLKRLRLSSIDVAEIDDQLFEIIINEPRFMPHLHLSLQAGDNMILKRMKRRHSREQVIEFCKKVKKLRKEVVFGADIIAGFPTETDEMFDNTAKIVEEAGLTYLHVFPYSEREGTPAARMPQVEKKVRKQRAKILRDIGKEQTLLHYKSQIGNKLEVITENENLARAQDFSLVKLNFNSTPGQLLNVNAIGLDEENLAIIAEMA
jgi:threonylcarbamoyladenosine tRNA methylthiotransferase MtaB